MPFGLKNAGVAFQRAMDLAFANEKNVFLVVYLEYLTVFSKSSEQHMYHLKNVSLKCRKYGLLLNPKKSLFAMEEGKLLGHIISKDGIRIDSACVQAIQQIDLPRNKKEIQSFNGKMNFLHRFVPNLTKHLKEMTNMLKKDSQVKWTEEVIKSFNLVKLGLSSTLVLVSLDYTQDFILFSFASEHTMAVALKDFWVYILHSHVLAYVPNAAVKDVLVQAIPEEIRGKWIVALLEYDIEINPTKLVKGQGLAKLMAESNLHALDINLIATLSDENDEEPPIQISEMFALSPWYSDIIYVLKNFSPPLGMTRNKARTLKLKAAKFCILNLALYWKDPDGVLLNCLVEKEAKQVMEDCHQGDCGGHLFWKSTANFFLRVGESYSLYQWGLDFIGKFHSASSGQHKWILTATDYFTKWIEAIPTRQATDAVIISFLENNILSHFGCPNKLITDNATAFKSKKMVEFFHKYHIILGHSTTYHLQGNGLVESSNKSLVNIIKKLLEMNKKSWHKRLVNALWADWVSQKKSVGMSLFELVYGVDTVFPSSLAASVVKLLQEADSEEDPMQRRLNQMVHLQQTREEVFKKTSKLQEKIKKIYDRKAKVDKFKVDDVVLKWDARNEEKGKHDKFENLWKGPFKIAAYRGQSAFLLKEINGEDCPGGPINGWLLKRYHF
eukprot:PITA_33705